MQAESTLVKVIASVRRLFGLSEEQAAALIVDDTPLRPFGAYFQDGDGVSWAEAESRRDLANGVIIASYEPDSTN